MNYLISAELCLIEIHFLKSFLIKLNITKKDLILFLKNFSQKVSTNSFQSERGDSSWIIGIV